MSRDKIVKKHGKKESRSHEGIFEQGELLLKNLIYFHEISHEWIASIKTYTNDDNSTIFDILSKTKALELASELIKIEDLEDFITFKVFLKTYVKDWKQLGNSNTTIQFGDISLTVSRELYQKNLLTFVKYGQCLHYALQPATFTKHLAKDDNDKVDLQLVSKELNHLADILHVYARALNFMK